MVIEEDIGRNTRYRGGRMVYPIGIDLGTTNSVISIYRRGQLETIQIEGRSVIPSVISYRNKNTVLIGEQAKRRILIDPEHSVSSSKRFIGFTGKFYEIYDHKLTPTDVASMILNRIKKEASKFLGGDVKKAVITVPAYFTEEQRKATRQAGEQAGLNVLRLIPEPTAAAIAYGIDKARNQTLLIYDLGGGTFDVSILQLDGNHFKVLAVDGDSSLGGDDFDKEIMNLLIEKLEKILGKQINTFSIAEQRGIMQQLKEKAEQAKIELSQAEETEILIPDIAGVSIEYILDRRTYNQRIMHLAKRTINKIRAVLKAAHMTEEDVDRVILVGGSTRNTIIKEMVTTTIKEPFISERVDEVVSHGAALLAANLALPEEEVLAPIEVEDITAHTLGLLVKDQESNKMKVTPVIMRNANVPCRGGMLAQTVQPFQKAVELQAFRGEVADPEKCTRLGALVLKITKPVNANLPVGVVFKLDEDGILHIEGYEFPIEKLDKNKEVLDFIMDCANNYDGIIHDIKILQDFESKGYVKRAVTRLKI